MGAGCGLRGDCRRVLGDCGDWLSLDPRGGTMSEMAKSCAFAERVAYMYTLKGENRCRYHYVCKLGMYERGVGCGPRRCAYFSHQDSEQNKKYWAIKTFRKIANG